jgi:hypothetical protein
MAFVVPPYSTASRRGGRAAAAPPRPYDTLRMRVFIDGMMRNEISL